MEHPFLLYSGYKDNWSVAYPDQNGTKLDYPSIKYVNGIKSLHFAYNIILLNKNSIDCWHPSFFDFSVEKLLRRIEGTRYNRLLESWNAQA